MYMEWKPYVSVAKRRADALKQATTAKKRGQHLSPVVIDGRAIATSFWGKSWCENLESYADFSNRLPRGRTYARNGSVIDLQVKAGGVEAQVSGSSLYKTKVTVEALDSRRWKALVGAHASHVASVVDLLQGKLPKSLLVALADRASGLFPSPNELTFSCSCPDWADMCKHVAAVLYGVGHRLDSQPELFFFLRGVEVSDLAARGATLGLDSSAADAFGGADLGTMFGIELEGAPRAKPSAKKLAPKGATRKGATAKGAKPKTTTRPAANLAKRPAGKAVTTVKRSAPKPTAPRAKSRGGKG